MSKKVKSLIEKETAARLEGIEAVAVLNPRGIGAIANNQIRRRLREKNMRMTVVKNTLAARATANSKLKGFEKLLEGPSALVYGQGVGISAIARALLEEKKTLDALELRGAFFDGEIYEGEKGIDKASKLPTREEAIGNVIAAILGPGKKIAGALKGPGGTLGALLKTIEEKGGAAAAAGEQPDDHGERQERRAGLRGGIAPGLDQHEGQEEQRARQRAVEQQRQQVRAAEGARAKHRERHHRRVAARFHDHEANQRHEPEPDGNEQVAPVGERVGRFDQSEHDAAEAQGREQRARPIQFAARVFVAALGHVAPGDRQRRERDRNVDPERPAPRQPIDQ